MPTTRVGDLNVVYDEFGSGPPVLMINGIGAARDAWGLQAPVLGEHFWTITYDNRDVGETGAGDNPEPYPMRQFADDAAGLLDELAIPAAHIIGGSMGGAIAQEFALAYPDRTLSATIVCSWGKADPWLQEVLTLWEAVFASQGVVQWSRTTWAWVFSYRWYHNPSNLIELLGQVEASPYHQTFDMYRRQSMAAASHDALNRLPQLEMPVHIIAGEEDYLTPVRYSEEIAEAIPHAQFTIMRDVGHAMFWETTDEFNALLIDFIQEVEQAG
jgi:3-oxoadipate enol-lactonase